MLERCDDVRLRQVDQLVGDHVGAHIACAARVAVHSVEAVVVQRVVDSVAGTKWREHRPCLGRGEGGGARLPLNMHVLAFVLSAAKPLVRVEPFDVEVPRDLADRGEAWGWGCIEAELAVLFCVTGYVASVPCMGVRMDGTHNTHTHTTCHKVLLSNTSIPCHWRSNTSTTAV